MEEVAIIFPLPVCAAVISEQHVPRTSLPPSLADGPPQDYKKKRPTCHRTLPKSKCCAGVKLSSLEENTEQSSTGPRSRTKWLEGEKDPEDQQRMNEVPEDDLSSRITHSSGPIFDRRGSGQRLTETLLGSYSTEPSQALLCDNNLRQIIHRSALSCKRRSVLQQRWRGNRCVALRLMGMVRMSPLHAPSSWCLGPNHLSSPRRMPPKMPGLGSGEGWSCQSHQRGQTVSSQAVKLLFRPAHHEKVVAGGRARRQVPAAGGKQPGKDCA
ncbi:uncharacterized protein LOC134513229 isoform X2 [Chroicocephalus ridibundus]|uniref:uncharacterized protein LOC134513229 isoform X2 n=1 Tax=Chroicocephalus ridibundus TaxID=1192867 RepID=UPI002FDE3A1A